MTTRRDNQRQAGDESRQGADAPYNFIPLPEKVVTVFDQPGVTPGEYDTALPSHNQFASDRRHGYFDVTLTTESPLYIRGPLTRAEAEDKAAHRNKSDFFHTGDPNSPVIPGSSLRGMIRALVEIVTWGKLTRVSESPKMFYRAVAAQRDDPLGANYKEILGKHVRAGYAVRDGDQWFIQPATQYKDTPFVKVKALNKDEQTHEDVRSVEGLIALNSGDYHVQYHDVVRVSDFRPLKNGGYTVAVRSSGQGEARSGVLVCTGNMAESSGESHGRVKTNRRNFTLVLECDPNAQRVQISPDAVKDYRDSLTPFQQEFPFDEKNGCLVEGRPIFYVPPQQGKMVQHFGHAPFFRIAATIRENSRTRAVTPYDFIGDAQGEPDKWDFAEAMFGYVRTPEELKKLEDKPGEIPQGDRRRAYAGRVSVTDAHFITATDDPYDSEITPPILGSPKATTFQHYLEQPQGRATARQYLYHYDSKNAQGKPATHIRGHKLYWRQRRDAANQIPGSTTAPLDTSDKQRTRMRPVRKGMQFSFCINFENLTDIELGALTWVLTLGSEWNQPGARHMLGMGKPFGMGVVKLDAALQVQRRQQRYTTLFSGNGWANGDDTNDAQWFTERFVEFMSHQLGQDFESHGRMQELLTMLEGRDPDQRFTYMSIEPNEFTNRLVLPRPSEVIPSAAALARLEEERRQEEEKRQEEEERQRRREEAERQRAEERASGITVGKVVRGTVTATPDYEDEPVEFTLNNVTDGRRYVGYLLPEYRQGALFAAGQLITAFVLEIEEGEEGELYLWCRRATKEERK